jgi:formylglycine-generating enzyme
MTTLCRPGLVVALLPLGLLLSAGCNRDNAPATGIIVEVTSDLRVPGELNQVRLTAKDPKGASVYDHTFDLGQPPNRFSLPLRAGLYPLHDTSTPIHIEAVGQLDGQPVVSRSATLSFVHGQKVVLVLPLWAVCKDVACKVAYATCKANGACEGDAVVGTDLPKYVPDQPVSGTDAFKDIPDAQALPVATDAAVEKTADSAADRAWDLAMDAAGGRDTFFATGGAGGTDAPSATGGAIGTDGGQATADARTEVGDTPGTDTPPDVPVGGSGGNGGTTATGGITASGGKAGAGGTTTTGGTTGSGGTTSAGGTTTSGGTTATGGTTASGGSSGGADAAADGGTPPSCSGLAATCGPSGNESCCTSLPVPGGTFYRSYDNVTYTDKSYPATVADFALDKYEITVGRFRAFVNAGMGTQASPPALGAGIHPLIANSGWDTTWNTSLPADTASLKTAMKCDSTYQTWTDTSGGNENRPQNCMDWYLASAFCAWDGGRLPTEAEWNYAAAGGTEQRAYPWSSPPTSTTIDDSYAVYCGGSCSSIKNVGSKPAGNGKWGHADLAGNVWEWTLDWYVSPYPTPCNNCAYIPSASYRVYRGGSFNYGASTLRSAYRYNYYPVFRSGSLGSRCARTSL